MVKPTLNWSLHIEGLQDKNTRGSIFSLRSLFSYLIGRYHFLSLRIEGLQTYEHPHKYDARKIYILVSKGLLSFQSCTAGKHHC